jgi:purine-binding chemotaxis protein CheW
MVAVTPVPEAPPWVLGVIDLHGRVIPVVDLRQRFDQPPKEPALDDRLLVVQALEQTVALMVDEVTGVLEVPAHQVEPSADPLSQSRPLVAVVRQDEGLLLVLDAARLLPPAEAV